MKQFKDFVGSASKITIKQDPEQRDFRIKSATDQGKITLSTFQFSRGTDFRVYKKDESFEGLHVICTFLIDSFSDYTQLIGRTARQGKNGSVKIFLPSQNNDKNLASKIKKQEGQNKIKQIDQKQWKNKQLQLIQKIDKAKQEHQLSQKIYSNDIKQDNILSHIQKLNHQPFLYDLISRTVICIDGTGSMSEVFQKLKKVIKNAMPDIQAAIQKSHTKGSFQIKFVVYRNYSSPFQQILEFTNFYSTSKDLLQWLQKINTSGGQGNEALQVCLNHINKLKQFDQIIIIADAKANSKQQVSQKRKVRGQNYWNKNEFYSTSYQEQIQQIKKKNKKCHSYYINSSNGYFQKQVKPFYKQMSNQTGGKQQQFKIRSSNSTNQFTQFVSDCILTNLCEKLKDPNQAMRLKKQYENIVQAKKKKYIA